MSYETRTSALAIARPANTSAYTAGDVVGFTTSTGGAVLQYEVPIELGIGRHIWIDS